MAANLGSSMRKGLDPKPIYYDLVAGSAAVRRNHGSFVFSFKFSPPSGEARAANTRGADGSWLSLPDRSEKLIHRSEFQIWKQFVPFIRNYP